MKKKFLTLALSTAMGLCLAGGVASFDASADETAKNVINAVTGDASTGFVTEEEWAAQEAYAFTGANKGSVKLATVGTNLFFRMVVEDATNFNGKDRIAYTITTNGVSQNIQGNYDPWLTGEQGFGDNIQTELAYNADLGAYVATIGFNLGDNYVKGNEVNVSFTFNDSTSEDIAWGAGAASTYSGTLYLASEAEEPETPVEPEEPEVAATDIISAVTGDASTRFVTEEEWAAQYAYAFTGANKGSVKLATVGTNLFFRMVVEDATNFNGKDRIAYTITTNGVSQNIQGNYDPWLTGEYGFGPNIQTELAYNADLGAYVATIGFNLGDNYVKGNEVSVSFTFNDSTSEDIAWGAGAASTYSGTLYLGEKASAPVEPEEPEVPEVNYTYVVPLLSTGLVASDWDACEAYVMNKLGDTTGASGTVKFIVANGILYFQMEVEDATQLQNDRPDYTLTIGGKTASARGKYDGGDGSGLPWLADRTQDFGQSVLSEINYTDGKYTMTIGFDIGDLAVEGAHLAVEMSHGDAQTVDNGWGDSPSGYPHAIQFAGTLYLGAYSETDPVAPGETPEDPEVPGDSEEPEVPADPEPTPGPENVDLGIVVVDLPSMPTESDWANATAYDLIPNTGNITGATGTIKIYTAANNIFYRVEVNDPTTKYNVDGIYMYIGVEDFYFEGRGNYDNWIAEKHNDLGSPSLFECKTSASDPSGMGEGVYTFSQGFYLKELVQEGVQIRLCFKHRDARYASDAWQDADYTHTIYFDQIITFGAPADLTIRPQEATEGFTGSAANVSYNKTDICWSEFAGAETYNMYVYEVNPEGSEEAYTHLSIEGPIYAGLDTYEELISGLSEKKDYVVQLVAYDANEEVIAYSELIEFTTISRQEAMEPKPEDPEVPGDSEEPEVPGDSEEPVVPGTSDEPAGEQPEESKKKGGCGSVIGLGATLVVAAGAVAAIMKKKED